jgi:hypothetical protein
MNKQWPTRMMNLQAVAVNDAKYLLTVSVLDKLGFESFHFLLKRKLSVRDESCPDDLRLLFDHVPSKMMGKDNIKVLQKRLT